MYKTLQIQVTTLANGTKVFNLARGFVGKFISFSAIDVDANGSFDLTIASLHRRGRLSASSTIYTKTGINSKFHVHPRMLAVDRAGADIAGVYEPFQLGEEGLQILIGNGGNAKRYDLVINLDIEPKNTIDIVV